MKGRYEDEVFFIVGGIVQNFDTKRYFESGHMINHDCIFENVPQPHIYKGFSDTSLTFSFSKEVYLDILESHPEIKNEIKELIFERN